jgi:hypothetical protein
MLDAVEVGSANLEKRKKEKGQGKAIAVLALLLYSNQETSLRVSLNLLMLTISN